MPKEFVGDNIHVAFGGNDAIVLTEEVSNVILNQITLQPHIWLALHGYIDALRLAHANRRCGGPNPSLGQTLCQHGRDVAHIVE